MPRLRSLTVERRRVRVELLFRLVVRQLARGGLIHLRVTHVSIERLWRAAEPHHLVLEEVDVAVEATEHAVVCAGCAAVAARETGCRPIYSEQRAAADI